MKASCDANHRCVLIYQFCSQCPTPPLSILVPLD
ncbi:hypothetical protein EIZ39_03950 [Ammoniphilus sp. CFH 90114]|nr:hypothetical protein EIZ39_03950 [Ammoniphilus sp. CFH 90114]